MAKGFLISPLIGDKKDTRSRAVPEGSDSHDEYSDSHTFFLTNKILLFSWEMKDKGEVPITLTS